MRRDFLHKLSTHIAQAHGVVVIEDLQVRSMTRSARGTRSRPGRNIRAKAALNRAILAQDWGELARQLAYKVERAGGTLVEVPPHRTSQRCSRCGAVDAASRSGRTFACTSCGHAEDADTNAAKNILAAGLAVTARRALQAQAGAVNREPPAVGDNAV
jgi:putative transposase